MKINLKALSALGLLSAACAASAADAPAAPTLGAVLESSGISATGYVAASAYRLSTTGGTLHQFDIDHSTFSLDQAALTLAYQPAEGFGAVVGMIAGQDAQVLNFTAEVPGVGGQLAIPQAFLQYKTGGFTIMAGKMLTLAGAEVIAPTGNTNFSRGLLFYGLEPLFHTGIRASYAPNDMMSFTLGVNNGWNVAFDSSVQNSQKTVETGVSITPITGLSIGFNGYFGNESGNGTQGATNLFDVVVSYSPTSALTFVLNYDLKKVKDVPLAGVKKTLKSDGVALYGNWAINDMWRLSLRLEQLKDGSDVGLVTGTVDEKVKEATLTVGFMPTKSSEVRFEVRKDKATDKLFTSFGGTAGDTDSQTEFAVQGLYKF